MRSIRLLAGCCSCFRWFVPKTTIRTDLGQLDAKRKGARGLCPISVNEDAAIWAAASKSGVWIPLPDGSRVHPDYRDRVIRPDGTWTFVGSVSGDTNARDVLITFGDQSVFGTIPC